MANEVTTEKGNLAIHHKGEAGAPQSDCRPESVSINNGINRRRKEDREDLEGLGEFEPHEGHEDQDGVVEELEEGEFPATEDGEEGAEGVEETGEVKDVGPEEDAPRWTRAEGEAEEPLKWGGFRAAPEPSGVTDLGGGGEEDAGEDGG